MLFVRFPLPLFLILPLIAAGSPNTCERTCGGNRTGREVPFPFGFSPSCEIPLSCTPDGDILVGDFTLHGIQPDFSILIRLETKCDRPIRTLRRLFTRHFAPTSRNGILLNNCSSASSMPPCVIPATAVRTSFQSLGCGAAAADNSSALGCYAENGTDGFLSYEKVVRSDCRYLLSSVSVDSFNSTAIALDFQMLQLGWWLGGHGCSCHEKASCSRFVSPVDGSPAHRCRCREGFFGDGFLAGMGCRKVSSNCNPSNYMHGECGGAARFTALIGGVLAGVCAMTILGLFCCLLRRRSSYQARRYRKKLLSQAAGECTIPIYPYEEIERATKNFSEKQRLGTGAYGTVYSGKLNNDEWVAIKRIKHRDTDSVEQVMNEIKLLSSVSHPNLVRLLGCSIEKGEQILVYEFMPSGTLSQHLQRSRGDGLPWPVRLKIAAETANAIAHLHSAIHPPIYHRDIKSSNILLDRDFKSKVADFGLSRLGMAETSLISTAPQGTPGYLDPQYHQDFHLSDKSDVYSFGVVLVEVITALKVVDFSRPQNEVNLAALAVDRIGKGCLDEIVDPFLLKSTASWGLSSVYKVAELAFRCLAYHRDMRPAMVEVAAELEQIRASGWDALPEEADCPASLGASPSSSLSEKSLSLNVNELGLVRGRGLPALQTGGNFVNSVEVSVEDPWLTDGGSSSLSSNSLLNSARK